MPVTVPRRFRDVTSSTPESAFVLVSPRALTALLTDPGGLVPTVALAEATSRATRGAFPPLRTAREHPVATQPGVV